MVSAPTSVAKLPLLPDYLRAALSHRILQLSGSVGSCRFTSLKPNSPFFLSHSALHDFFSPSFSPALAKCLPAGNHVRSCQSTEAKYLDERTTLPPRPALLCVSPGARAPPATHFAGDTCGKPNWPASGEEHCNASKFQVASGLYCIGAVLCKFLGFLPKICKYTTVWWNLRPTKVWVRMQGKRPGHQEF